MRSAVPLLLLCLAPRGEQVFIGTVDRVEREWLLALEGEEAPVPLRGVNPWPHRGGRVQVVGTRDREGIEGRLIDGLHPPEKDLVLVLKAAGAKASILEYFPQVRHRHPPGGCKVHAWTRQEIPGSEGRIEATVRVPAYSTRTHLRVFVRVEGEGGLRDGEEYCFNGEDWVGRDLKAVSGPLEVALEAP